MVGGSRGWRQIEGDKYVHKPHQQYQNGQGWTTWRSRVCTAVLLSALCAAAHTLPVSYLRLVPDADYLHLELVFNPFELSFVAEVDDNKDNELDPGELAAHGQVVAERVVGAVKISVGGQEVRAEMAGMDPDLSGHHVRLRAHYRVDARRQPLTLESELNSLMNASHLTQVTYANSEQAQPQLAQLDSQSRKVTFQPPPGSSRATSEVAPRKLGIFGWLVAAAVFAIVITGGGIMLRHKHQRQ
jgi:hypothetical protein